MHLFGQMADMRRARRAAARRPAVVEDACQAHGAARDGVRPGEAAAAAAFSFYPTKNLGALGDAGALVTADAELAATARALRQHGERERYVSERIGYTARLDTLQAAVLLRKLPLLDGGTASGARPRPSTRPRSPASATSAPCPSRAERARLAPYPVRTAHADGLRRLPGRARHRDRAPLPAAAAPLAGLRGLGHRPGAFPVAESLAAELVSLPIFPGISEAQLEWVAAAVREYFDRGL